MHEPIPVRAMMRGTNLHEAYLTGLGFDWTRVFAYPKNSDSIIYF